MKYLSLFEEFKISPERVQYFVEKIGQYYRIFALTPVMAEKGLQPEDAENIFGKGTSWKNYSSYEEAEEYINALESGDEEFPEYMG